jgi:hypothetical protein
MFVPSPVAVSPAGSLTGTFSSTGSLPTFSNHSGVTTLMFARKSPPPL